LEDAITSCDTFGSALDPRGKQMIDNASIHIPSPLDFLDDEKYCFTLDDSEDNAKPG
jgi:hypothetical protein